MYYINKRPLSTFESLPQGILLEKNKNYLFDLSWMIILDVIGERSAEFLQGQLSCDIQQVDDRSLRQGAFCNLKGRVLALMDVFYAKGFHLVLPKDLLEETQHSLEKAAAFSKVRLQADENHVLFGFYCQSAEDILPCKFPWPLPSLHTIACDSISGYHLDHGLCILVVPKKEQDLIISLFPKNQWRSALDWQRLQLCFERFSIYPETRGMFLPHDLNLHKSGYLNFEKGCYKGQEIIARMHYKAKLKHQLELFKITTNEALYSGQPLYHTGTESVVGELVDYAPLGNNNYLAAISILKNYPENLIFKDHAKPSHLELIKAGNNCYNNLAITRL